ncbi:MAG: hypothetical protein ACK52I_08690 [Pseudomonadota bacterium]
MRKGFSPLLPRRGRRCATTARCGTGTEPSKSRRQRIAASSLSREPTQSSRTRTRAPRIGSSIAGKIRSPFSSVSTRLPDARPGPSSTPSARRKSGASVP